MPPHPDDGSPFFQLARTIVQQANFSLEIHVEEPDRIVSHYDRVSHLYETVIWLSESYQAHASLTAWLNTIVETQHRIIARLETLNEYTYNDGDEDAVVQYANVPEFETIPTGGRPRISLPWQTITAYRQANHSWKYIADILGISAKTLLRYRQRYHYRNPAPYSTIADNELDMLVSQLIDQTIGVIGSQFMLALLQDHGIKLQRHRVRASIA
jgi:hypothetical protein